MVIEEEILKNFVRVLLIAFVVSICSYLVTFYAKKQKEIEFYKDVGRIVETIDFMKRMEKPSYLRIRIFVPSGCRLRIDNFSDTILFGCEKLSIIRLNADILLVQGGKNCEVENGEFKSGLYEIELAYVDEIGEKRECVVFFNDRESS